MDSRRGGSRVRRGSQGENASEIMSVFRDAPCQLNQDKTTDKRNAITPPQPSQNFALGRPWIYEGH
jgi:hypothetical protein